MKPVDMKIILGSQSPARKKILEDGGFQFDTMSPNIDEKAIRSNDPEKLTLDLAKAKASALREKINEPALLITADQVITWNGKILEKPVDVSEAREFLRGYRVHPAETVTAVVVTNTISGQQNAGIDTAKVFFHPIPEKEIEKIVREVPVLSMAGGFSVEHPMFRQFVDHIEGTKDSIIGLPIGLTRRLIERTSS